MMMRLAIMVMIVEGKFTCEGEMNGVVDDVVVRGSCVIKGPVQGDVDVKRNGVLEVMGDVTGKILMKRGSSLYVHSGATVEEVKAKKEAASIVINGCVESIEVDEPLGTSLVIDGLKTTCKTKLEITGGPGSTMGDVHLLNAVLDDVKIQETTFTKPMYMVNAYCKSIDIESPSCENGAYIEVASTTVDGDVTINGVQVNDDDDADDEEDRRLLRGRRLSGHGDGGCPVVLADVNTMNTIDVRNVPYLDAKALHADTLSLIHVHGGSLMKSTSVDEATIEECEGSMVERFIIDSNCFMAGADIEENSFLTFRNNVVSGPMDCEDNSQFVDGGGNRKTPGTDDLEDCSAITFVYDPDVSCSSTF